MIVGRQISQRLTTSSHGVLTVSHDTCMANVFPSVDQDAIEVTASSTIEKFGLQLFQDRSSSSVAFLDTPSGTVHLLAHSGFFMGDGNAPDMFSAVFEERIEIWTTEFDAKFPARCTPMKVEDLLGEEHR